jgi:hypothetical protein
VSLSNVARDVLRTPCYTGTYLLFQQVMGPGQHDQRRSANVDHFERMVTTLHGARWVWLLPVVILHHLPVGCNERLRHIQVPDWVNPSGFPGQVSCGPLIVFDDHGHVYDDATLIDNQGSDAR